MFADFPLFLAPMAGVTNTIFRRICKARGADVLTTEFVSAEGILHRNARTRHYLEFFDEERPLGVQLFGADPEHLAEAARAVIEWVQPDFLDLNFGCPVNKVVCRNGGSALLRDCPLLARIARTVVCAAHPVPVTAKIRIGWDHLSINAVQAAVIAEVAAAVGVPVIGNGDIASAQDALKRKSEANVAGLMIGRAAMASPWIFSEIRASLVTGTLPAAPTRGEKWQLMRAHSSQEIAWRHDERSAMKAMRYRLMAYTRGMPGAPRLRHRLARVESLAELEDIAASELALDEICLQPATAIN